LARSKPDPKVGEESSYLRQVAERLRELLGERLIGVYAGGSYALGDYRPERSDLDIAAVVDAAISDDLKERVVARLRHESLPCPARGLELVVYRIQTTRSPTAGRDFELNLNSGARMPPRVDLDPTSTPSHWFPIDRSILAQAGIAILGPPAGEVFAPIPVPELLPVLVESVRWHRRNPGPPEDAVLNACRALRFANEGLWSSKPEAGRWAIDRNAAPPGVVMAALAASKGKAEPDRAAVEELLDYVEAKLLCREVRR
jgi:hypothetical protein